MAALRTRLTGVAFLLVIVGLVGLTVALYTKAFTPVVRVTLQADRIGNQLATAADVKIRGKIVGDVRSITTSQDGAELELALDPSDVQFIPADVQARLIPKTLFGEKFVDLVIPEGGGTGQIKAGDVIPQDRSETALETETALNNLLPLLQALKPAEVSTTLNAVSTALRGRGDQIGQNLEIVEQYVRGLNPDVTTLGEDFGGLADLADTLEAARPDLIAVLDNLSFINRSLVDTEPQLSTFLKGTTTFAGELNTLLKDNETRLVRLAADSLPSLQVYQRYAPEFPCLAKGLTASDPIISRSFGGLQPGLHITLETVQDQGGYQPNKDEPAYKDDRGPTCYGLPTPKVPADDINFQDGYNDGNPPDDSQRVAAAASSRAAADPASALASPAGQRAVMGSVLAPMLGVAQDDVPDLAYLLFGPMARGTEVGLK